MELQRYVIINGNQLGLTESLASDEMMGFMGRPLFYNDMFDFKTPHGIYNMRVDFKVIFPPFFDTESGPATGIALRIAGYHPNIEYLPG